MKKIYFIFCLAILAGHYTASAQLPAFPTAEGVGKFVTGGRGTTATAPTIFEVTKLTDDGSVGTFRHACTNNSPSAPSRIIVFRVSGTIHLTSTLNLTRANTTIAGQTAPGEGICIADYPVYIGANNIIVRFLRFRLGDKNEAATTGNGDAFSDNGSARSKIIVDHCSMSWSNDEAFTFYDGDSVTLQWNILSEPLDRSYHDEGSGVQNHAYGGIWGGVNASFHHNLLAHCRGRMPRFSGRRNIASEKVDFRNNVIYNWADYTTNGGEGGTYNVVNNYYKYGPNTPTSLSSGVSRRSMIIQPYKETTAPTIPYGMYYLTGNYCDNSADVTNFNWKGASFSGGSLADSAGSKVTVPYSITPVNMESALDAYNSVLAKAGCMLPRRDTLDQRIANDVRNRTGKLIDCQGGYAGYPTYTPYATTQFAWPALSMGTAQTDTDHDGMPDNWETARGLNPSSATDRNTYQSTSGYNNVENYINGDTIVAVGKLNTCVNAAGFTSNNSGQWLYARDTSYSGYLNTTYTSAMDSNHIVAAVLDNGNYGAFSVSYYITNTDRTDISGWNYARRNITITPANPALIIQPVTVRVYISTAEFNALKTADPTIITISDIKILKSADNSCITTLPAVFEAIPQTASAVFGTYSNGYYIQFQTSSFSTFFFQSRFSPIPVKLSYFDVKKQNSTTAVVKWATEQEVNSAAFLVQRSNDASSWQTIATIAAAGNSSTLKTYSFTDGDNKKGTYFYRLIQKDIDGKTVTSETRKLNFGDDRLTIQVYPNPAKDVVKVYVPDVTSFEYTVVDMTGRKLISKTSSSNNALINVEHLQPGTYLIQVNTSSKTANSKIIIQHQF